MFGTFLDQRATQPAAQAASPHGSSQTQAASPSSSPQAQVTAATRLSLNVYANCFTLKRDNDPAVELKQRGQAAVWQVQTLHTQLGALIRRVTDCWHARVIQLSTGADRFWYPCCDSPRRSLPAVPRVLNRIVGEYLNLSELYRLSPEDFERQKRLLDSVTALFSEDELVENVIKDIIATIATLHVTYNTLEDIRQQLQKVQQID